MGIDSVKGKFAGSLAQYMHHNEAKKLDIWNSWDARECVPR